MGNVVILQLGPLYTLEEVKEHLRVETPDDDGPITAFMEAAESAVLQYCNLTLVPPGKEAIFKIAALMAVSDMYENRSGLEGLPQAARTLLNPYRWLRV